MSDLLEFQGILYPRNFDHFCRNRSFSTGGHLERPVDVFADSSSNLRTLAGDRIKPENIYGAACTFSSALAACLALGHRLDEAIILAKAYVTETIRRAYPVGNGRVPLNQLYRLQELTDAALPSLKAAQR